MYLNMPEMRDDPNAVADRYVGDLQRFVLGDNSVPVALPYDSLVAYQANLRLSKLFLPVVRHLLASPVRRLRDLAAQTVLPFIQEQLGNAKDSEHLGPGLLRNLLNTLCPDADHVDLQIDLCRQLAHVGVDQAFTNACIAQLEKERLVTCSECQSEVQAKDLELHLRRAHQIFQFRGTRQTYVHTRNAMLKAICTPPPDQAGWESLQALAEDKHPGEADRYVAVWVLQYIKDADGEPRGAAIPAVAEVIAAAGAVERLLPLFVGAGKNASWLLLGQRIALELCAASARASAGEVGAAGDPLSRSERLTAPFAQNAVLGLLVSLDKKSPLALDVLRAFVSQTSKKRGLEKLQQLEQRFGHARRSTPSRRKWMAISA